MRLSQGSRVLKARRRREQLERAGIEVPTNGVNIVPEEASSPVDSRVGLPQEDRGFSTVTLPDGTQVLEWTDPPPGWLPNHDGLPPLLADNPWEPADDATPADDEPPEVDPRWARFGGKEQR
jgi:hypothetical protein